MTQLTRAALQTKIDTFITSNGNNEITGAQVNTLLKDVSDSLLSLLDDTALLVPLGEYDPARSYADEEVTVESGVIFQANKATTGTFEPADWDKIHFLASTEITDFPSSLSGQALKGIRVNAGETAYEHVALAGTGDMEKATYDAGDNGVVDDSELLDGDTPAFYLDRTNHTGTQDASTIGAGSMADARIQESNVTQHEAAIDHDSLANHVVAQHRIINDAGSSTIELFSADKILTLIAGVVAGIELKDPVDTVSDTDITLSGEQTIGGLLTNSSRVLVNGQTSGEENGIYISAPGAWSRSADADEDAEVNNGLTVLVLNSGSSFFRFSFSLTTSDPITVDTTPLSFAGVPPLNFGTTAGTATEGNDPRVPTQDENDALAGTDGAPSAGNKYITDSDPRLNAATETEAGVLEVATQTETNTGTADDKIITPDKLASSAQLAAKAAVAAEADSGVVIDFTLEKVFGTLSSQETGNITFDFTNAKLEVTQLLIHNDGTTPTFPAEAKKLQGSLDYATSADNFIYFQFLDSGNVLYTIRQL